jgi:uncharacterized protein (UPF0335 family)
MSDLGNNSKEKLKSLIERIERVEEEKLGLQEDIKDIFQEAKSTGFDTKVMRMVIRLRKMNSSDRMEQEEILEVYKTALGML